MITELRPAGAERCVYELATRLDKDRFDVEVLALRGGAVADWLAEAGVKVHVLGVRGKWDVVKLSALRNILREGKFDLLHTHLFHADLAGRIGAAWAGVPHLVNTVHIAEARFRPWQYCLARVFAKRCRRIICVSEAVRDHHSRRSGLPASRYTVIHNGIDASAYSHDPQARQRLRNEWGVGADEAVCVFLGRLDRQKGVDVLLAAFSHLGARGAARRLIIAGDGPQRSLVENYISHGEGGRMAKYLGFVRDVRSVLSAGDVFVMPSRWEGFGLAAAEAMAAGLPVVATRVAGLGEVVLDGETGVLVEKNDAVELAEQVERLLRDAELRRRLGEAGRQRVFAQFSLADNIAAHAELYTRIVCNGR
jgi:glycosyltransferase involved in cell wall biosynthesis